MDQVRGRRFVLEEPDERYLINPNTIRAFVGNDVFYGPPPNVDEN